MTTILSATTARPEPTMLVWQVHPDHPDLIDEVLDWFEGEEHPKSPEGHIWGREAHAIIGTELAAVIRELE